MFANRGYYIRVYQKYAKGKKEFLKEFAIIYLGYHEDVVMEKLNGVLAKFPESEGFECQTFLFGMTQLHHGGKVEKPKRIRLVEK